MIKLDKLIGQILDETQYTENNYFRALKEKRFLKEDFLETQIQFYFAVTFFSRPMAGACLLDDYRVG